MNPAFIVPGTRSLTRRTFLGGAGVALALPLLDAITPAHAAAMSRR